jgi:hypothetical protein
MREVADTTGASQRRARSILNATSQVAKPTLARRFDLEAGIELAHGHVAAAERLAWRAAALREAAQ